MASTLPTVLLVGLTGGIGSGKSTVAELLAGYGAVVIDADAVAREVVEPGTPAYDELVTRFGRGIVAPDGALDRAALAARAFTDTVARADLERITHPAIQAEFARRIIEAGDEAVVVCDVPLLVESGSVDTRGYTAVIVVEAPPEVRIERLVGRGLSMEDARARMKAQASDEERRAVATHLLDNRGNRAELSEAVRRLWQELDHIRAARET